MAAVSPSSSESTFHNQTKSKMPSLDVVSTAYYESGPPLSKCKPSFDEADVFETVKEEAWEEKKVKTTKKTKNIERRVQRQLVLEDGEVKEDTGPVITEDCTEDTVTNEVVSNENQRPQGQIEGPKAPGEGWVAIPGGVEISEKCTKTINSHEEVEDELETEEIQHCGDVTNKEAEDHVLGKSDLRSLVAHRKSEGLQIALPDKRVVHEATRKRGNVDTVDVKETTRVQGGHVVTETERTVCKEEYDNESAPDSGSTISDGSAHETKKETSHNLIHTKDEDLLEYYAVPRGATLAQGVKIGEGMHVVSEDVQEDRQGGEVESLEEKYKREGRKPFRSREGFRERTDALTRKPLDYQQEEKTRKKETNRWLEAHFGSESGQSATSSVDGSTERPRHSVGGNRINITMSPRPATPEDIVDNPIVPVRRNYEKPRPIVAKIPPPPPPKPERNWSSSISPTSPPPYQPREIQESELTAARARLRSTGLSLKEENKENNYPSSDSPPHSPFNGDMKSYGTKVNSSVNVTPFNKEPVFSSRFRSGHSESERRPIQIKNYVNERNSYSRESPPRSPSPQPIIRSTPQPAPAPTPLSSSNVGRSQSFHISTLPWFSRKKSEDKRVTHSSTLKDYKSEERLDNMEKKSFSNTRRKLFERFSHFAHKEPTPPPPPRQPRRNFSSSSSSAEAATQTSPTPVPPPRTKRKKKVVPTSSYFFGQEEPAPTYRSSSSHRHGSHKSNSILTNGYDDRNSYSNYNNRNSYEVKTSPKIERRYRTTKTITPVVVMPLNSERSHYRDSTSPRSTWTNTVDPRRKPRKNYEYDRSATTLPRKLHTSYSSPKRQYFFGENDSSSDSYSNRRVSSLNSRGERDYSARDTSPSYNTLPIEKSSKHVGRSHSFNYQAGNNNLSNQKGKHNLSNISSEKTSSVYRSSPYLNLRSPNLIANIARTPSMEKANSVNNLDSSPRYEHRSDDTKDRFMEGLLNTAPELFHFIHGEEKKDDQTKRHDDSPPPRIIRPTSELNLPNSPTYNYKAKVFTFGKGNGNNSLRNSEERQIHDEQPRHNHEERPANGDHSQNSLNRRTAFNLKTSGRSLLYAPAFRERINSEEMYSSRNSLNGSDKYRREHSSRH